MKIVPFMRELLTDNYTIELSYSRRSRKFKMVVKGDGTDLTLARAEGSGATLSSAVKDAERDVDKQLDEDYE